MAEVHYREGCWLAVCLERGGFRKIGRRKLPQHLHEADPLVLARWLGTQLGCVIGGAATNVPLVGLTVSVFGIPKALAQLLFGLLPQHLEHADAVCSDWEWTAWRRSRVGREGGRHGEKQ